MELKQNGKIELAYFHIFLPTTITLYRQLPEGGKIHLVEARQGARTDTEFQSRLRVMDIDEAGAAQVMGSVREEWRHLQTN